MKKLFFIVLLLSATVFAHAAKVGFLVIGATDDANALPYESYRNGSDEVEVEPSPERAAYSWFKDTYSATSKECILISTLQEGSEVPDDIDVLWVNLDRNGENLSWETEVGTNGYDVIFNSNVCTALKNFIKRGGNLLLTKQAARLVSMINRISEYPTCEIGSYIKANDSGSVQEIGSSTYKVFNSFSFTENKTQLLNSEYKIINGIGDPRESVWKKTSEQAASFETENTCKILGRDGETFDKVGFVEFYPRGDYQGTVLVMGLHAYQWSADMTNANINAVKQLTQNMLDYLCAEPNITWNAITTGVIGSTVELSATAEAGFDVAIESQDETKATYSDGNATWQYFGSATLRATATPQDAQKGIQVPKNATTKTADHTVTISGGDPATYGYVLTYSLHTLDGETLKPDYTAAKWFYDNYVSKGTGCFINPTEYSSTVDIPSAIKVLWVHSDKWGLAPATYYAALGGDNFRDALKNYIKAGGNAFLSKQATRLIGDIGRAQYYPCYEFDSECSRSTSDTWYMTDDFKWVSPAVSRHWHRAFRFMTGYSTDDNVSHWPLVSAESSYRRTDHWYLWGKSRNGSHVETDTWGSYGCVGDCDFNQKGRLTNFESKQKCTILGGWGQTANLDAVGMAEFYPATMSETDFKGSVITMGLGAYQWTTDNTCANMANLTKGVLEYLTDVPFVIHHNGDSEGDPREVNNYKETYAGGKIGTTIEYRMKVNALDLWYSLYLPFTVDSVQVWDGGDNTYYDLVPYYRTGGKYYTGHYIIRTPERTEDLDLANFGNWNDPTTSAWLPTGSTPYIIQWHDSYFTNKYISFFGHSNSDIPTSMTAGTAPSMNNVVNICGNDAMNNGSVAGAYLLEGDYGTWGAWLRAENPSEERTILPFECYILANEATRVKYRSLHRGMKLDEIATGHEQTNISSAANGKMLIDGHVMIVRDNKMYNVLGLEVK